ncbi:MAG: SpoIID/LytB domain-containing protein [Candidatus Marinimicrobia bacterium]|nr:SpoIID/LytB domain-containing protein [Candidatus Neomarinimicrobiota bacterium]
MKKRFFVLLIVIFAGSFSIILAEGPLVRVRIMYTENKINLSSESKINIYNQDENKIVLRGERTFSIILHDDTLKLVDDNGKTLITGYSLTINNSEKNKHLGIKQVPFGIGWFWAGNEDRIYKGDLEFHINANKKIDVISILDIETYLLGVVPSEIGVTAPIEALKAQAICARSEAVIGLETGKYSGEHHNLTADIYCQVYSGIGKANNAVNKAVLETRSEVLVANDTVISAYYASNCGGHSENIENVWPERSGHAEYWSGHPDMDGKIDLDLTQANDIRTWIEGEPDSWCKPSDLTPEWSKQHFRWTQSITPEELSAAVAEKVKDIGLVYDMIPLERGVSGRIYDILFVGEKGHCRLEGELNIRMLWKSPLKSSCFVIDKIGTNGHPVSFILTGAGWGHGVGMCQTGAIAQANAGRTYKDILTHYFRGSKIEQKYK